MNLHLIEKSQTSSSVISLFFQPDQKFDYQPGQYLRYTLNHPNPDNRGVIRYFTIASAPQEPAIMITTRLAAQHGSSFKSALSNLNIGDEIEAEGPRGSFTYPNPNQKTVWIAGGIGITPFRSMLMDLTFKKLDPDITLFYANRNEEIVFKELIDHYLATHQNFKVIYVVEEPSTSWQGQTGRISPELIKKFVPDYQQNPPLFYASGPEPMVEGFGTMLESMGIPKDKFKQDFFPGYQD